MFLSHLNESREGFCRRGRGRSFHVDGSETEKVREPIVENLVLGICMDIRSRAETTGGCVKLKTITAIRWSSARDTFIAEGVYLVLEDVSQVKKILIICSCIP